MGAFRESRSNLRRVSEGAYRHASDPLLVSHARRFLSSAQAHQKHAETVVHTEAAARRTRIDVPALVGDAKSRALALVCSFSSCCAQVQRANKLCKDQGPAPRTAAARLSAPCVSSLSVLCLHTQRDLSPPHHHPSLPRMQTQTYLFDGVALGALGLENLGTFLGRHG